jgi:hypothetical protein
MVMTRDMVRPLCRSVPVCLKTTVPSASEQRTPGDIPYTLRFSCTASHTTTVFLPVP